MPRTAYELDPADGVPAEMRRVVRQALSHAITALAGGPTVTGIHQARKACKRARAAIDLVPGPEAKRVAAQTRDGARFIGPARDADVLAALAKKGGAAAPNGPTPEERARDAALAARYLRGARQLASGLPYEALTDDVLVRRITRTWRRSRRELERAAERPSAERLHEWRKAVKRLLYQATLLAAHHPGLAAQIEILDELQERLGDHHDLHALLALFALPGREVDLADLEERALTQGGLVLGAEPEAFSAWLVADRAAASAAVR